MRTTVDRLIEELKKLIDENDYAGFGMDYSRVNEDFTVYVNYVDDSYPQSPLISDQNLGVALKESLDELKKELLEEAKKKYGPDCLREVRK